MINTVVLNSSNLVKDGNNNKLVYRFPQTLNLNSHQIAVSSVQMFYSWFNITSQNQNNYFQYRWFDNATYDVSIPDGFYDINSLNAYLQSIFVSRKHYLVNSNTNTNVYFLSIDTNSTYYSTQLNAYAVSQTYATSNGWILPSGASWTIPATADAPDFIIPNNKLQDVLGMYAGIYPPIGTSFTLGVVWSKKSDYTPQVSPVNSLIMTCSLLNSFYGAPNNIIYSFGFGNSKFGSMIDVQPNNFAFNKIYASAYNEFTLAFYDQNMNPIKILDPSMVVTLCIQETQKL
jgi:hypothetical protein